MLRSVCWSGIGRNSLHMMGSVEVCLVLCPLFSITTAREGRIDAHSGHFAFRSRCLHHRLKNNLDQNVKTIQFFIYYTGQIGKCRWLVVMSDFECWLGYPSWLSLSHFDTFHVEWLMRTS